MNITKSLSIVSAMIVLIGTSACESGVKVHEIVGTDTPAANPEAEEPKSAETIAPAETKAPDAGKSSEKPEKPEGKKPEDEKKPDGEKKPPVIKKPIFVTLPPEEKTMKLVRTDNVAGYECKNCGGSGGKAHDYRCPTNYVVTGYELGTADFGCPRGKGGCADYTIIGTLRVTCARPTPVNIDPDQTDYAQDYESGGSYTAGAGSFDDPRADACAPYSGVATGVFGRSGSRLDSIGFLCGSYSPTMSGVRVYNGSPAKKTTYQWPDSEFGGAPGIGGSPFSLSCPESQVIVGLRIRSGSDVDGIEAIYCATVEAVH